MTTEQSVTSSDLADPVEEGIIASERPPEMRSGKVWDDIRFGGRLVGTYLRHNPVRDGVLLLFYAALIVTNGYLIVFQSLVAADLTTAFTKFDRAGVTASLTKIGLIIAFSVVTMMLSEFFAYTLKIRARSAITERFADSWMKDGRFHRISRKAVLDHPEQRIQDDISVFVEYVVNNGPGIFSLITPMLLYSVQLWRLSQPLSVEAFGSNIVLHGYLLYTTVLFSIAWTFVTHFIGAKLTRTEVVRQRLEAQFRQEMASIRENSEAIAFERGAPLERMRLASTFRMIQENWRHYTFANLRVVFASRFPNLAMMAIPAFFCAPFILDGRMRLGDIGIVSGAMQIVFHAAGFIVANYQAFAILRSATSRLRYFDEAMNEPVVSGFAIQTNDRAAYELHGVTIDYPDGQLMVEVRSIKIEQGVRLLIKGPSGAGKSTFLRVLAGLWTCGEGTIRIPRDAKIRFLPQRSFMPNTTLAGLLSYPRDPRQMSDESLHEMLNKLHLSQLSPRLHEYSAWKDILSPGEQQRVAVARTILAKPDFVFLDEATSALDPVTEAVVYDLLVQQLPESAIISVAHRQSVERYHDEILELTKSNGGTIVRKPAERKDRMVADPIVS